MSDLRVRLRNPMWAHSNVSFESPQLEQEENIAAMNEAADEIDRLHEQLVKAREALASVADFMRKDVQSGDSDLWTPEYEELHDDVIVALAALTGKQQNVTD